MHTPKLRILTVFLLMGVVAALLSNCDGSGDELRRVLTRYDRYTPPKSDVKALPDEHPTIYVRRAGTELRGVVNAEPLAGIDDEVEKSLGELGQQLLFVRRAMQERAGDGEPISRDILLVLDKNLEFADVMRVILVVNRAGFSTPHLVTKKGYVHTIETPMVHPQSGPMGWAAWIWVTQGDTLRWMTVPESIVVPGTPDDPSALWMMKVPPAHGAVDYNTVKRVMSAAMDTIDYIPEGIDRLVGIWAYDELPYEGFTRLLDALRTDPKVVVGGRITAFNGPQWAPPPDTTMAIRHP